MVQTCLDCRDTMTILPEEFKPPLDIKTILFDSNSHRSRILATKGRLADSQRVALVKYCSTKKGINALFDKPIIIIIISFGQETCNTACGLLLSQLSQDGPCNEDAIRVSCSQERTTTLTTTPTRILRISFCEISIFPELL